MKRFLATMMVLILLLGCAPLTAFASSTVDLFWTCPLCGRQNIFLNTICNSLGCSFARSSLPSHGIAFRNAKDEGGSGQWEKQNNNKMKFRCKVYNNEDSRTVKAVEIAMYAKDVWGDLVWSEDTYYTGTTTCEIKPGHWHWTEYFVLPNRSEIYDLYVYIKRIAYTDGTVIEIDPANAHEVYWTIKW